jgi:hypothetical protein
MLALSAAHEADMLHRDIKPANLLLSEDGRVKLADFGLVKLLSNLDSQLTLPGGPIGTPSYMSPEQCQAEGVDASSDIYSLGATYFALLTGRAPYEADSVLGVMFAHCSSPVPNLEDARIDAPPICADVIRKAMAKDPADRFSDVDAFADALSPLLGEAGRRERSPLKGTRTVRRRWIVPAVLAAGLTLGMVPFVVTRQGVDASPIASTELTRRPIVGESATDKSPGTVFKRRPKPESWYFSSIAVVGQHRGAIVDLAFDEQGRQVVALGRGGALAVWDPERPGKFLRRMVDAEVPKATVYSIGLFPQRRWALVGSDTDLVLWDLNSGEIKSRTPHPHQAVRSIGVDAQGKHLVTGGDVGLRYWELQEDGSLRDMGWIRDNLVLVHSVRFSQVRALAAAVSGNGFVVIHPFDNPLAEISNRYPEQVVSVALGRARCEFAFGTQRGQIIQASNSSRLKAIGPVGSVSFPPSTMDFAPNRRVLAVSGGDAGAVAFFDMESKRRLIRSLKTGETITVVRFSPDGEDLAMGTSSGKVYLVRVPAEEFSSPVDRKEVVLDLASNYIPTGSEHFNGLRALLRNLEGAKTP